MILLGRLAISYEDFARHIELPVKPFSNKYIGNSLFKLASSSERYKRLCAKYDSNKVSLYKVLLTNEKGVSLQKGDIIYGYTLSDLKENYEDVYVVSDMDYHCIDHFSRTTEDFEKRCTSFYILRMLEMIYKDNIYTEECMDSDKMVSERNNIISDFVNGNSSILYGLLLSYEEDIDSAIRGYALEDLKAFFDNVTYRASVKMVKELKYRVAYNIIEVGEIGYIDKTVDLLINFMIRSQEELYNTLPFNVIMRIIKKCMTSLDYSIDNSLIRYKNKTVDTLTVRNMGYLVKITAICKSIPDVIKETKRQLQIVNDHTVETVYKVCDGIIRYKNFEKE